MIISLFVSLIIFYGVSIIMFKLNSEFYLKRIEKQRQLEASAIDWERMSVIITAHVTGIVMTSILGPILFRKLSPETRYEIYIGYRVVVNWFLDAWDCLKEKIPNFRRKNTECKCEDCLKAEEEFKAAVARTEIINFCLSIPKEHEKKV